MRDKWGGWASGLYKMGNEPFKCVTCHKVFDQAHMLVDHLKEHRQLRSGPEKLTAEDRKYLRSIRITPWEEEANARQG